MKADCPRCAQSYDVPESFAGEKIKCVRCGEIFIADAPPLPAAPAKRSPEPEEKKMEQRPEEKLEEPPRARNADIRFTLVAGTQPPVSVRLESFSISFDCIFKIVFAATVSFSVIAFCLGLVIGMLYTTVAR